MVETGGCMHIPAASLREKASHQSPSRGCGTGGAWAGKALSGLRFLRFAPLSDAMTSATPQRSRELDKRRYQSSNLHCNPQTTCLEKTLVFSA